MKTPEIHKKIQEAAAKISEESLNAVKTGAAIKKFVHSILPLVNST
jgi:hypothetical protein